MKNLNLLLFLLMVGALNACKLIDPTPKPTADFTFRYGDNGLVHFNLSSSNADSYSWDFGDGASSSEKLPDHRYERNGKYIVKVIAKGKGGEVTATQSIDVTSIRGNVMFWMQKTRDKFIDVYVDGKYYGQITGYYSTGTPDCGATYCVSVNGLEEGQHYYEAREANSFTPTVWKGSLSITGGQCNKLRLTY